VEVGAESREAGCSHRGLGDRRLGPLLEVAQEPPRRYPWMPARLLARNQERELERIGEADARKVPWAASAAGKLRRSSARRKIA